MNLVNHTMLAAELGSQRDMEGFEYLLLVAKGSYRMPLQGEAAEPLDHQQPLHYADTALDAPGLSSPYYECELTPPKPACDVLLLGSAHAPQQVPAKRVVVALEIQGKLNKTLLVHGKRHWNAGLISLAASDPVPFTQQRLSYDIAYGGADQAGMWTEEPEVYAPNPVGCGYASSAGAWLDGKPMAQTEPLSRPIRSPGGKHVPMGFGPVGRGWAPRAGYAGTYDQAWIDERYPLLPTDFDPRYFQAAPADQQVASLATGDRVVLRNLVHPTLCLRGHVSFKLPDLSLQCFVYPRAGVRVAMPLRPDTLCLEPDEQRFSITWKAVYPLGNDPASVRMVELGDRRKLHFARVSLRELQAQLPSRREDA